MASFIGGEYIGGATDYYYYGYEEAYDTPPPMVDTSMYGDMGPGSIWDDDVYTPPTADPSSPLDWGLNLFGFDTDPEPGDPGIWEWFEEDPESEPPSSILDAGLNVFGHDTDPEAGDPGIVEGIDIMPVVTALMPLLIVMPMLSDMFGSRR